MGSYDFVILSKDLFYKGDNYGYIKEIDDYNLLLFYIYFESTNNRIGIIGTSLGDLITFSKQKINMNKGKSVDKARTLLKFMADKNMIEFRGNDVDKISVNEFMRVRYNPIIKDDTKFVMIPTTIINKILSSNYKYKNRILTYWCYLHSRRYMKKDAGDNKASVAIVSYDKIQNDIGLSRQTINKYNDILVNEELLLYDNCGDYIDANNKIKESCNIYVTIDDKSIDNVFYKNYLNEGKGQYKFYIENVCNGKFLKNSKSIIK